MPIQTITMHSKDSSKKQLLSLLNMTSIHYIIGQISANVFKVDATTLQSATYRSSMMLNEVSSL
jgi:hypothetical protein